MEPNLENIALVENKKPIYAKAWVYVIIALVIVLAGVFVLLGPLNVIGKLSATPTPAPTPIPTIDSSKDEWLFDITFDEWLDNVNAYRNNEDLGTIEKSDIDYEDQIYTLDLNQNVKCSCMCPEGPDDNRIYVVFMAWYPDGTEESIYDLMSGMAQLIRGLHPEYTFDEVSTLISDLFVIDESEENFAPTYLEEDETYYYFEVKNGVVYLDASPLFIDHD